MAIFHDRIRARVDELVDEDVRGIVLLSSVTALASGGLGHNAENAYVAQEGLDPEQRIEEPHGGFGLICALGDERMHFLSSTGSMHTGDVAAAFAYSRAGTDLRHRQHGMWGARQRMFHLTFPDGRYYVGSSAESRLARSSINNPGAFLDAFGTAAQEID